MRGAKRISLLAALDLVLGFTQTLANAQETPLHKAAAAGDKELVTRLLAEGADVNAKDNNATPLHYAVMQGHKEVVELLLANGADINARSSDREPFRPDATKKDLFFVVPSRGQTPLHRAVFWGRKQVVELLLAKGADVNAKDATGRTPLLMTAEHKAIAELLLAKGADVNAKTDGAVTPLHWVSFWGNKEMAELLLAKGAEVNAKDKRERTPLDVAKTEEMKALLRKYGAK